MVILKKGAKKQKSAETAAPAAEEKSETARPKKKIVVRRAGAVGAIQEKSATPAVDSAGSANSIRQAIKKTVEDEAVPPAEKPAAANPPTSLKDRPELAKQEVIKVINEEISRKKGIESAADVPPAPIPAKTEFNGVIKPTPTPIEQKMISEFSSPAHRSVSVYKKISISFIAVTLVLVALVSYYSFVKTTIIVEPKSSLVSASLFLDVYDENTAPSQDGGLIGIVKSKELAIEGSYPATGGQVLGEEAIGKAKIINNYIKNQPLVATTRLLSADNKLFRIKDTVNVPAGGSVEVAIYADQPSAEMAIGPSRFSIPGLWAGIQDKIYAESSEPVVYRQKKQPVIAQADLDNGSKELKDKLVKQAEDEAAAEFKKSYDQVLYKIDDGSFNVTADAKAGDEKESIQIKVTVKVAVVAFKDEVAKKLAEQKLKNGLAAGRELTEFDRNKIAYSLTNFDLAKSSASVEAKFDGKAMPKQDASFIDKEKLVGLSAEQLNQYLSGLPEVAAFEIKFSPSFLKRTPNTSDHIIIELKK